MNNHRVRNKLLLLVGISVAAFCVMVAYTVMLGAACRNV